MFVVNYSDASHNGWLAVTTLFVWLVPHVSIKIAELRLVLTKSRHWEGEKLAQGYKTITTHSSLSLALCLAIIAGTAAGIHLSTRGLDIEMIYVLSGLSKIFSAVTLFLLSIHIPTWLSIYYTKKEAEKVGSTLKALRFNVWWGMLRYIFMIYFFLLPFFCYENNPVFIPLSIIFGIIGGFLVFLGVYLGRTRFKSHKRSIAIAIVVILVVLSSLCFALGCNYISTVWRKHAWKGLIAIAFFVWLITTSIFHALFGLWSRKKFGNQRRRRLAGYRVFSSFFRTAIFHPKNILGSAPSQVVTEPTSIIENGSLQKEGEIPEQKKEETEMRGKQKRVKFRVEEDGIGEEEELPEPKAEVTNTRENQIKEIFIVVEDGWGEEGIPEPKEEETKTRSNERNVILVDEKDNEIMEVDSESQNNTVDEVDTYWSLIRSKCSCSLCTCCSRHKGKHEPNPIKTLDKVFIIMRWAVWTIAALCCLYVTIINIAGMHQFSIANKKLGTVDNILYKNTNGGKVCAFNETGLEGKGPLFLMTFENADAALSKNFTIAHCGECGACSNPPNLGLQWTTRKKLTMLSQDCVKKSSFDGYAAGLQCFKDTIGFDPPCSKCWLTCGQCAAKNCLFLYLQQMIINKLTNFEVASGVKNAPTCEEAMCELDFVPCSGANRRRMNIHGDIERPSHQMCKLVNESLWVNLFGP
jgi:hypothetical protein